MANLIKIDSVVAYFDIDEIESYYCKKILDEEKIPHNIIHADKKNGFDYLNSLSFGYDFVEYEFTKCPIIIWREFYDDYERFLSVCQNSEELKNSSLVKYKNLIK